MSDDNLQFVNAFIETTFWADVNEWAKITNGKPWSIIKESETVQEDELERYIKDYEKFASDLTTYCNNDKCSRFTCDFNPFDVPCHKRHMTEDPKIKEDALQSERNTQEWIWEQTEPWLRKKFHVTLKKTFTDEDRKRFKEALETTIQQRDVEVKASDEMQPWFSFMGNRWVEKTVFAPLRKPGIKLASEPYQEKLMMKKVSLLIDERGIDVEKLVKEREQEETAAIAEALHRHKEKFPNVLNELCKETFLSVDRDDVDDDDDDDGDDVDDVDDVVDDNDGEDDGDEDSNNDSWETTKRKWARLMRMFSLECVIFF